MVRNRWLTLSVVATLAACTPPSPEQQIVEDAAEALGGRSRIEGVNTLSFEGEGEQRNFGQDMTPDAVSQTFTISDYRQSLEIPTRRTRVEQTRTPNFAYFRGPAPMRQVRGLDGDIAYNVAPDGAATRASTHSASDRLLDLYLFPLTAVRAALDPTAVVSNARRAPSERLVDVTTSEGLVLTLAIDASTKLPLRVSSKTNHPNLRDVVYEARFSDYESVSGVMLPSFMSVFLDGNQLTRLKLTGYVVNGDVGDLSAPDAAASAPPPGPAPVNVTAEEVAAGVWFLAGQSHHSVLVELSDHTLLIEAPSEARTLAVIAKARELVPDKPLTYLVSTHHHFDHSGGVRAAISEGLSVITQAANATFYQELAKRPSTITPDALANNPQPARIEAVEEQVTHGDNAMRVELYRIADNPHCDALLMAYLPRHRLLVEADAFSPSADYHPFAGNLLENIRQRNLRVDRLLPIHGEIVTYDELVSAVESMDE